MRLCRIQSFGLLTLFWEGLVQLAETTKLNYIYFSVWTWYLLLFFPLTPKKAHGCLRRCHYQGPRNKNSHRTKALIRYQGCWVDIQNDGTGTVVLVYAPYNRYAHDMIPYPISKPHTFWLFRRYHPIPPISISDHPHIHTTVSASSFDPFPHCSSNNGNTVDKTVMECLRHRDFRQKVNVQPSLYIVLLFPFFAFDQNLPILLILLFSLLLAMRIQNR